MMSLTCLILIASVPSVFSTCLDAATKKACDNMFSNEAMSASCSPLMNEFQGRVASCHKEIGTSQLNCKVANCVTEEKYQVSRNGKMNMTSCKALLDMLDKQQPKTKDMNQKIRQECIANDGYKQYETYDPNCEVMMYMTCAYCNYLRKLPSFNSSPPMCQQLAKDTRTCDPNCDEYLKEKRSTSCK